MRATTDIASAQPVEILAGVRHDRERPFVVVGGAESMQYPFALYGVRGKKIGEAVQKYGPIDAKTLPAGTHLQDMLLMSLYDPSAKLAMANTAEELARLGYVLDEEEKRAGLLPWIVGAIRLLIFTGARLSEILTLQWDRVDFARAC